MTDSHGEPTPASPSAEQPGASEAPGSAASGGQPPVLALAGLSKTFGGAHALNDVDMTIGAGEVHGLLGENGSGKSTLIKVLNGFHAPDSGSLEIAGEPVALPLSPGQFRDLGLSFVHQDLGLILELTVLENLRVGDLIANHGTWIAWRAERQRARETFAALRDRPGPVGDRRRADPDRARAAGDRARGRGHPHRRRRSAGFATGLLVLDEPTVFLPREGIDQLFSTVREIVASGDASVLFVSHDLDEVREVTDRVTVLRDGHAAGNRGHRGYDRGPAGGDDHRPAAGEPGAPGARAVRPRGRDLRQGPVRWRAAGRRLRDPPRRDRRHHRPGRVGLRRRAVLPVRGQARGIGHPAVRAEPRSICPRCPRTEPSATGSRCFPATVSATAACRR